MDIRLFGKRGEAQAEKLLRKNGYRIVARNYRTPTGELDIVAMDGETLVFVEVKSRRSDSFGHPSQAVDLRKQMKIERAALAYITKELRSPVACRFDVVGLRDDDGHEELELIKDAFEASGGW